MGNWKTISAFTRIGKMGKTHGADGEVRVSLEDALTEQALQSPFLFVDLDGSKVPFAVASWRVARGLTVKFLNVDDASAAAKLVAHDVYLPSAEIQDVPKQKSPLEYAHLVGYRLQDKTIGSLGVIEDVQAYPQQEMAVVAYREESVLIPLNPVFIQAIHPETRMVEVELPPGLLDQ